MVALSLFDSWTPSSEAREALLGAGISGDAIVERLVELGALVEEGSTLAELEGLYEQHWVWGVDAGLLHFGIRDAEWSKLDQEGLDQISLRRQEGAEEPNIFLTNEGFQPVVGLPEPAPEPGQLLETINSRRSWRSFTPEAISLADLATCLHAGLRITRTFTTEPAARALLKTTPSPGAKNPHEAYVFVQRVEGLEPGVYHYSAIDHTLGRHSAPPTQSLGELFGGQHWATSAAFGLVLVCYTERLTWKYRHPNTYAAMFLEAGHIMQNVMLAATSLGLRGSPTNCFADSLLEEALAIPKILSTCTYAAAFGVPDPTPTSWDPPLAGESRGLVTSPQQG